MTSFRTLHFRPERGCDCVDVQNTSKIDGKDIRQDGPVGYNFEPQFADAQLQERSNTRSIRTVRPERHSRRLTLDWCRCGKCDIMLKEEECLSCREVPEVADIFQLSSETMQCLRLCQTFILFA